MFVANGELALYYLYMGENSEGTITAKLPKGITISLALPWFEILGELWKQGRKLLRGHANEGMYEVLEYETTLEMKDPGGKTAIVHKREKVKYLQDYIIAYQDQAWGDGEILLNYRCSPGKPVDRYRPGKKTFILISLQEVKRKGDVDEFNIEWGIRNGFVRKQELWETEIRHRTKQVKVQIILPKSRPPKRISIGERIGQRTKILGSSAIKQLLDGRWMVTWEKKKPRLYESYALKWEW